MTICGLAVFVVCGFDDSKPSKNQTGTTATDAFLSEQLSQPAAAFSAHSSPG